MKNITAIKKPYWHELTDAEIKELKDVTWVKVVKTFKQPDWCSYPRALNGVLGCWSLTDKTGYRHLISRKYCRSCDCYIKKERNATRYIRI